MEDDQKSVMNWLAFSNCVVNRTFVQFFASRLHIFSCQINSIILQIYQIYLFFY